jgi:hypothetical protein
MGELDHAVLRESLAQPGMLRRVGVSLHRHRVYRRIEGIVRTKHLKRTWITRDEALCIAYVMFGLTAGFFGWF